jgi:hypothetical protein
MKATEFLKEDEDDYHPMPLRLADYRGSYDPRSMEAYPPEFKDSFALHDIVEKIINSGKKPIRATINPNRLIATQDWLSDYGSDEEAFPEYPDLPVVLDAGDGANGYYILDGHHRTVAAMKKNKNVEVYLFRAGQ